MQVNRKVILYCVLINYMLKIFKITHVIMNVEHVYLAL